MQPPQQHPPHNQPPHGQQPSTPYNQPPQYQPGSYQPPYQSQQHPGYPPAPQHQAANNKVAAGICGIILGGLGVHKFILGYTQEGVIMLLVSVLTCGIGYSVMGLIGLIEGIIYLTKSDPEFAQTYIYNKKGWF